jgi:hypothetical protein
VQQANGVGFVDAVSVLAGFDVELVELAVGWAGDEAFPDPGGSAGSEAVSLGIPFVEAADDRDRAGVGSPDAEDGSRLAVVFGEVGSHFVVDAVVAALVEEVEVLVGEEVGGGEGGVRAHGLGGMWARLSLPEYGAGTMTRPAPMYIIVDFMYIQWYPDGVS